jgi:nucleoside-diphosphate-sugar epimerase
MKTTDIAKALSLTARHVRRLKKAGDVRVLALDAFDESNLPAASETQSLTALLDLARRWRDGHPDLLPDAVVVTAYLADKHPELTRDIGRAMAGMMLAENTLWEAMQGCAVARKITGDTRREHTAAVRCCVSTATRRRVSHKTAPR